MKTINILSLFLLLFQVPVLSQSELKHIREGNELYKKEKFEDSEVSYRKAIEKQAVSYKPNFNLGDALYKQGKFEESADKFSSLNLSEQDKIDAAKVFHNLGNSMLQSNKIEESIEAYKNALRSNPNDMETKYNLAFAQDKLKKQQQNQEQQDDQQQDKEDQNKDQQQEGDQEDQQKNQQDSQENKEDQSGQNEQKEQQISKEDAERLLQALENDEMELLKKLKKNLAKKTKVRTLKDW